MVGLALLAWMWVAQWRRGVATGASGIYARAVLIVCAVSALFTSVLLDAFESHLYALLSIAFAQAWGATSGGVIRQAPADRA